MDLLTGHADILRSLKKATLSQTSELIKHLSSQAIKVFSGIAFNILKGTVPLASRDKRILLASKSTLQFLSRKRKSIKSRRHKLVTNPALVKLLSRLVLDYFAAA
jgi:hypothetical protein